MTQVLSVVVQTRTFLLQECIFLHVQAAENCQHHFQLPVKQ